MRLDLVRDEDRRELDSPDPTDHLASSGLSKLILSCFQLPQLQKIFELNLSMPRVEMLFIYFFCTRPCMIKCAKPADISISQLVFQDLIRIRTPNRGIDPTVTHIHETIITQKNIEESFKED